MRAVPVIDGPSKGLTVDTTFVFWEAMGYWHPNRSIVELTDPRPRRPAMPYVDDFPDEVFTVTTYHYVRGRKDGRDFWVLSCEKAGADGS